MLSKAPSKITVGEVIRFIDGPTDPISCVKEKYSNCADMNKCVFKDIWRRVAKATSDIIDTVTFQDLVTQVNAAQQVLAYSI